MSRKGHARQRAVVAAVALLTWGGSREAHGQRVGQLDRTQSAKCIDAIPPSALSPTIVYVVVDTPADAASLRGRPRVQDFLAPIASRIRARTGGGITELAFGEPLVTWRGARAELAITAYRDGRLAWAEPQGDSLATAGVRLLAAEMKAAVDSGARISWPASVSQDSMTFTFRLTSQSVSPKGVVSLPKSDRLQPLFTVMQPSMEPAFARPFGGPKYPEEARHARVEAALRFSFVVDTSGRAEINSLAMTGPADARGVMGTGGPYRFDFIAAVREHMRRAHFVPARIGGCAVRMNVEQSFEFRISR